MQCKCTNGRQLDGYSSYICNPTGFVLMPTCGYILDEKYYTGYKPAKISIKTDSYRRQPDLNGGLSSL